MKSLFTTLMLLLLAGCSAGPRVRSAPPAAAGEPAGSPLFAAIARADAELTKSFDAHDLAALMALFAEDVEFYHDTGGLQRYADVERGFGGLFAQQNGIRRELIPGSLRVFPIQNYGALELGAHRFCHVENGGNVCGVFEFVHLWRREGEAWKLARVMSYGH